MVTSEEEMVWWKKEAVDGVLETVRIAATPYLPPPVVNWMEQMDQSPPMWLDHNVTSEPSTLVLSTLVVALLVLWIVTKLGQGVVWISNHGNRSALVDDGTHDDDDEDNVMGSAQDTLITTTYKGDTVVLCGPSGAGKTLLFHTLQQPQQHLSTTTPVRTVTSLKANAAWIPCRHAEDKEHDKTMVRLVDYPGHAALQSQLSTVVKDCQRIVLVLDSTKPVAEAATVLYQLLTDARVQRKNNAIVPILVVCHKCQLPGAKNWRRLKIQLRTELERLRKVKSAVTITTTNGQTTNTTDDDLLTPENDQQNGSTSSVSPMELG
eukprot:CAMPEP_0198284670 /NCGR_PEP_ID=MMETSP1449-20131203/4133_1 /TAXON_ID=420275 /ORGANISM="Attheya septentrionalis, Strain CCMP2084" /LENGTH=320 /DNA_ID=CAMNT_0043981865 /DNA_START=44 /DNA_END=1002 /DNA_ORIENTATION=+